MVTVVQTDVCCVTRYLFSRQLMCHPATSIPLCVRLNMQPAAMSMLEKKSQPNQSYEGKKCFSILQQFGEVRYYLPRNISSHLLYTDLRCLGKQLSYMSVETAQLQILNPRRDHFKGTGCGQGSVPDYVSDNKREKKVAIHIKVSFRLIYLNICPSPKHCLLSSFSEQSSM